LFDPSPLSDNHPLVPVAATHSPLAMYVATWLESPGEASIVTLSTWDEIVTFGGRRAVLVNAAFTI
jgi:hypothetical protein